MIIYLSVEQGGHFEDHAGLSRGCSISPLFGALYLKQLDDAFEKAGIYYVRYRDDILILSKTRWQNRRAVKQLNQVFNALKVKQHPAKTFIGKIERALISWAITSQESL